jgi:hypothetical protein
MPQFQTCNLSWLPDFLLWKMEHQILEGDSNALIAPQHIILPTMWTRDPIQNAYHPRRQTPHFHRIGNLRSCKLNMDLSNSTQVHNLTIYCISIRPDCPPTSYVDFRVAAFLAVSPQNFVCFYFSNLMYTFTVSHLVTLMIPWHWLRKLLSPVMWNTHFCFKITCCLHFICWRWRQQVPVECCYLSTNCTASDIRRRHSS